MLAKAHYSISKYSSNFIEQNEKAAQINFVKFNAANFT